MALFLSILFLFLVSSATACDRCIRQSKAAYYYDDAPLPHGACGYESTALELSNGLVAGIIPALYKEGAGCGACFQVRCKNKTLCSTAGTKVVVTDRNNDNRYDVVLSRKAYSAMAQRGKTQELLKMGTLDVEYKRIPCEYKNKNLLIRVVEWSQKPYYLAIKLLYQGGQTEIKAIEIAQAGSSEWVLLKRNYGVIWDMNNVPEGSLQLRILVASGYGDENWVYANYEIPEDWKNGETYDTGVQIDDIAKEVCPPSRCGDRPWK